MRIVLIKIVRLLEDGLEPPLTYDEANKKTSFFLLSLFVLYDNSGSLIGWVDFHTFTCTGNIAMCWEPDAGREVLSLKYSGIYNNIMVRLIPAK